MALRAGGRNSPAARRKNYQLEQREHRDAARIYESQKKENADGEVLAKGVIVSVHGSSYGRICASHFCVVGSVVTRLMAETLPLMTTPPLRFPFVCSPLVCVDFFGLQGPSRTVPHLEKQKQNKINKRQDP